jgi:hypothetical protein
MTNQFEWGGGAGELSGESYESQEMHEFAGEAQGEQGEIYGETEGVFNETQEMELAAELLSVSNEQELQQFLGSLIKRAGQAVGSFVKSPVGQQLGGILKSAAKKALPVVGGAIGGHFGGAKGADIGGKIATQAGRIFGLELEGLSNEDQELEVARRFVRFAGAAAARAASAPRNLPPQQAARTAALTAARRYAPGLLRGGARGPSGFRGRRPLPQRGGYGGYGMNVQTGMDDGSGGADGPGGFDDSGQGDGGFSESGGGMAGSSGAGGRWMRKGRQIIIFNC